MGIRKLPNVKLFFMMFKINIFLLKKGFLLVVLFSIFSVLNSNAQFHVDKSDYIVYFKTKTNTKPSNKKSNKKKPKKVEVVSEKVTAKYKKKLFRKQYYLKTEEKKRIYPDLTDSIYRVYGMENCDTVKGYTIEGRWMFKTITGEIDGYNLQPLPVSNYAYYFKKGDSPFYKNRHRFKKFILKEWVQDDYEAYKLWKIQKKKMFFNRVIIPSLSVGLLVSSILTPGTQYSIIAGLAAPPTLILYIFQPFNTHKIVKRYNAQMVIKKRTRHEFFEE